MTDVCQRDAFLFQSEIMYFFNYFCDSECQQSTILVPKRVLNVQLLTLVSTQTQCGVATVIIRLFMCCQSLCLYTNRPLFIQINKNNKRVFCSGEWVIDKMYNFKVGLAKPAFPTRWPKQGKNQLCYWERTIFIRWPNTSKRTQFQSCLLGDRGRALKCI